jgi:uncharacterized protein YcbX
MPGTLAAIHLYPLKSCAALTQQTAQVERRGLQHDRRWMVIDAERKFLTGRELPRLTLIRAQIDADGLRLDAPDLPTLALSRPDSSGARAVTEVWGTRVTPLLARDDAHMWISAFLKKPCRIVYMDDDCVRPVDASYGQAGDQVSFADGFPLLLISQAALDLLNMKLLKPVSMLRFRPNLVIARTAAHAEDHWKRIRIGEVDFDVSKPCTRCVFTNVDFERGERDPSGEPLRTLTSYRRSESGVTFGQNLIPRNTGALRVGDAVTVLE